MGNFLRRLRADLMKLPAVAAALRGRFAIRAGGCRAARFAAPIYLSCMAAILLVSDVTANVFVRLDFNLTLITRARDTVFIELFDDRPLTRDNFLQYVDGGHYDESLVHRLARNFVLQGGGFYPEFQDEPPPVNVSLNPAARVDLDGNPATPNPTVNNEFTNLPFRSNLRGTLAMAKSAGNPNSATSEFFFNIGNNGGTSPNGLDFQNGGFTVFAQVAGDGMNVIDAYNSLQLANLNPDVNDDGIRDDGPFFNSSSDAVPFFQSFVLAIEDAERVNYRGSGSVLDVPSGGLTILARDLYIDTGAILSGTGPLTIGPGRRLGAREGVTIDHLIINQGRVEPGQQLGILTMQSFQQTSTGTLEIQLRQTTVDTDYDRLAVTNTAQLGGNLDVSLLQSFLPQPGNTFTVLTAANIVGDFASMTLPLLAPGLVWDVNKSSTAVELSVVAADFNRDGIVNAADYTVWRNSLGLTVPAYSIADGNGDTMIDMADYLVWKNNYGNRSGGNYGSGAISGDLSNVPEPASAVLLIMAAWFCGGHRRTRSCGASRTMSRFA
jgi:cyclophilin family peptidyl-prolyl cis-trans isomerase